MAQTLYDIMDKDKLYTMIYSGVENEDYFKLLYDLGIRDFLMSYHYIKEKKLTMDKYEGLGIKFFIDSGAHTYQNDPKYQEYPLEYWENHLKGYLKWAEDNKEYIFAIASFDFENLVGSDVVKRWYEEYFEPFMLRTGIPVCFVWHQNSHADWDSYCQRYPYVGFSSVNTMGESIDLNEYSAKLKVAERHNALVHGFGMTRTSFLPKLPFFTSDSTTWLVGLQYGEINYWKGTKMTRLKKDKWKGDYLPKLVSLGLDKDKLLAEDTFEMIKANIIPFIQAEKYIRDKLKSRMYWLKPKSVTNDVSVMEFPSVEWLDSPTKEGWEEYAKQFNISMEDPQLAQDLITDVTCFVNWYEDEYRNYIEDVYNSELIKTLHDTWVNKITSSEEEKIEDLRAFYIEVLEGKNDKLLVLGTNFDRQPKERDKYIEEELTETIDLTPQQFAKEVGNLLPPGSDAPEIDELDDEIFSDRGLVAVRDEKGRFLKGQKKVRKPKNIYSEKYPKLVCNTCYASQNCPEFKEGYVCAFNKMFKRFDCRNTNDIIEAMQGMVNLNMERMQRVAIFEMLDGGMPDGNLSAMIDQNMRLMMNMKQVMQQQEVIKQTRVVTSDGTVTETTSAPAQPGILERLFMSNLGKNKDSKENTDDINNIVEVEHSTEE